MRRTEDFLSREILRILTETRVPLETKEIELILPKFTRVKILYRLNLLRGDQLINGKAVGSGKGAWIWWKKDFKLTNLSLIPSQNRREDSISIEILRVLKKAKSPLETKEIEQLLPKHSRTKILYRLNILRGDRLIEGKNVGSGKGTWIWYNG